MKIEDRIVAFSKLGNIISLSLEGIKSNTYNSNISLNIDFITAINDAQANNPWFIKEFIINCLQEISNQLKSESLNCWLNKYDCKKLSEKTTKTVALITAGNIPLVGFHDILSILISGNNLLIKVSQKDSVLTKLFINLLCKIEPQFNDKIKFSDANLSNFDAIIATGSNNTSRYFDYYFNKYPSIIRRNRNSIAILNYDDSENDLNKIADDIFLYFGLGCRNVSKIFIPKGFVIEKLFKVFETYKEILFNHNKYMNNYEYNKAIFLVNKTPFFDNGFVLLNQNENISSPISVIYFEYYDNFDYVNNKIEINKNQIQCVISNNKNVSNSISIGEAQSPKLWDYSDNIDTMKFLLNLKKE